MLINSEIIMHGTQEVRSVAITDKGLRQANADAVFADNKLFVVADGVGMTKNSDLASQTAISRIRECCDSGVALQKAVNEAHITLKEYNQQNATEQPIGTTIVAAKLSQSQSQSQSQPQCHVAWVGDSRAYLVDLSAQSIELLTRDHSLVNKLVEKGDITREQARSHPQRNVITRCLGLTQQDNIKVDTRDFQWREDQILLLCSDGLSGSLSDEKILGCLQQHKSLDEQAQDLLQMSLKAGSKDNISLVLVSIQ